jgi:CheY-like chemotaxis protein
MEKALEADLISIYDVSMIFNLSIEAMRKYRVLGLIEPYKRVGRKDLYDKEAIVLQKYLIESYKKQGKSLQEIAKSIRDSGQEHDHRMVPIDSVESKKVLIVEDEEPVYDVLQQQLKESFSENELKLYYAKDGLSGIKEAERVVPDIIAIDVALPVINGIEVYKRLIKQPRICNSKFVFMSGNIKYRPEGTVYIEKPFKLSEFIKLIENLTGLQPSAASMLTA